MSLERERGRKLRESEIVERQSLAVEIEPRDIDFVNIIIKRTVPVVIAAAASVYIKTTIKDFALDLAYLFLLYPIALPPSPHLFSLVIPTTEHISLPSYLISLLPTLLPLFPCSLDFLFLLPYSLRLHFPFPSLSLLPHVPPPPPSPKGQTYVSKKTKSCARR